MKELFAKTIFSLAFCAFALPAYAAAPTAENPLVLTMTTTFMDVHPTPKTLVAWGEEIKEATGGRVVIEYYNPNTICPEGEIYDSVVSGLVQIGGHNVARVRGKFPLAGVMELPFQYSSAESGARSNWKMYEESPELQKEFSETHVLTFWSSAIDQIHSASKDFSTLANLKGAKLAAMSASYLDFISGLGASPVQLSPTDVYLSMQRGQIEGNVCPMAYMRSTKIYEAAKNSFICNAKASGFYLAMNKEVWDELPQDIKDVFNAKSGSVLAQRLSQATDKGAQDDTKFMVEQGHKVFNVASDEKAKMQEALKGISDAYIKECEARGLGDAAKALMKLAAENEAVFGPETQYPLN